MPPRGLAEKKKDKKKKVNFKEVEKKKTYSTKIPVSDYLKNHFRSTSGLFLILCLNRYVSEGGYV